MTWHNSGKAQFRPGIGSSLCVYVYIYYIIYIYIYIYIIYYILYIYTYIYKMNLISQYCLQIGQFSRVFSKYFLQKHVQQHIRENLQVQKSNLKSLRYTTFLSRKHIIYHKKNYSLVCRLFENCNSGSQDQQSIKIRNIIQG